MLPTIAAPSASRETSLLRQLDNFLFDADFWFAIDVNNRRVAGVPITSLAQGLTLIDGGGRVASIVGRLKSGFRAIDIDLDDVRGDAVTEHLVSWCTQRNLWHIVRPSGGGSGRHHIIVQVGVHEPQLSAFITNLLGSYGIARTYIDLRSALRPLSAPHRKNRHLALMPYTDLDQAILELRVETADHKKNQPLSKPHRKREVEPLTPARSYAYRPLADKWASYLATGKYPAWDKQNSSGVDTSRSTWELMCTAEMMRAGWSATRAWEAIQNCNPRAMTRARRDYQRWVTGVWNAAVKSDDAFRPIPQISPEILCATQEAADRLRNYAWKLPARERVPLLVIAGVLLRRMQRQNTLRVPCPERDLVLDTGIRDRKTVRKYLGYLNGRLGTLDKGSYDARRPAASSYEFEIPPASGVVRDIPPPSFHTPLAPTLPLQSQLLLQALTPTPTPPTELSLQSQLNPTPTSGLSPWGSRQLLKHLKLLQLAGLAQVDSTGDWSLSPTPPPSPTLSNPTLLEKIQAERVSFRSRETVWAEQRRLALQACNARALSWWRHLSPSERALRLHEYSQRFQGGSVAEQRELKSHFAQRDLDRGINLVERRLHWQADLATDYEDRRLRRVSWWLDLPAPLQRAYAIAWKQHREAFGLPQRVQAKSKVS